QTQGKTIHSPRNCLPGAGWEVLTLGTRSLAVGTGAYTLNRYTLKNGHQMALVYYWYQGRGRVVANEYTVKWNLLRDAALAGHTEEALVRVFLPVRDTSVNDPNTVGLTMAEADSLGGRIAGQLIRDVAKALPGELKGVKSVASSF